MSKRSKSIREALRLLSTRKGFESKLRKNLARRKASLEKSKKPKKKKNNPFKEMVQDLNLDGLE